MSTLFPLPAEDEIAKLPKRLKAMIALFGHCEGQKCAMCVHLYAKRYNKTYYKCDLNGDTNGPGTDWRVGWPACGRWEPRCTVKPLGGLATMGDLTTTRAMTPEDVDRAVEVLKERGLG